MLTLVRCEVFQLDGVLRNYVVSNCVCIMKYQWLYLILFSAMQCDPTCSTYKPCISSCPVETCDNFLDQTKIQKLCTNDKCVEGKSRNINKLML